MTLSDSVPKLLAASQEELEKLLDEFEGSPSLGAFFDIGATAEILSLDRRSEETMPLVAMLRMRRRVGYGREFWKMSPLLPSGVSTIRRCYVILHSIATNTILLT